MYKKYKFNQIGLSLALLMVLPDIAWSQSPPNFRVTVNSNRDGAVQADDVVTLREAIAITNGTLPFNKLSAAEKSLVEKLQCVSCSRIEFNLPPEQTTIQLTEILPPLSAPGLVIDGTTQPGYDANTSATAEITIPVPIVAITPTVNAEIFRGFTVVSDQIKIQGLNLYGFTSFHDATASLPPADIFIGFTPAPKNVAIENNWLGMKLDATVPETTSAFGVSVFNATGTSIRRNRIYHHDGSAIITGKQAANTQIAENIIVGNGIAGMPDAIRLEGTISNSQITSNLICANDGSGVYLFKSQGSVQIQSNNIKYNGRRLRRAGVYLMGNNHRVLNNQITNQTGSGVSVTAYPQSIGNVIQGNSFANLEGLSIDLNATHNAGVREFQRGDGPNPQRNSANRRLDTANAAINAPVFLSSEFMVINGKVNIDGQADPGSEIDIYRVNSNSSQQIDLYPAYWPLGEIITKVKADDKGRFGATLDMQPGMVSAIATLPKYGTSEPAANALIKSLNHQTFPNPQPPSNPNCTTRPVTLTPPAPIPEPELIPPQPIPEPIRLRVLKNIHFALDKDLISLKSGEILDRIAEVMQQYPTIVIELQGHTDSRASDAYNQDLATRRANNARKYLLKKGIAPARMTIRSFGERKLRTPESDRRDYARNRRVEVLFFDIRGVDITFENQEDDLQIEK